VRRSTRDKLIVENTTALCILVSIQSGLYRNSGTVCLRAVTVPVVETGRVDRRRLPVRSGQRLSTGAN